MKKLLVLLLVLGLTSMASAKIVGLSIDGLTVSDGTEDILQGSSLTIYMMGDTASGLDYLDLVIDGKATLALPVKLPAAGSLATVADFSTAGLYDYEVQTADSAGVYPGGVCFTSTLTATGNLGDTFTVDILDSTADYIVSDTITFTIVPEPVTIALLGLGGLFLRRRK